MDTVFYLVMVTAVTAALQIPARAQENAAPPPAQPPAPAQQTPVPGPSTEPAAPPAQPHDSEHPRFVFHRIEGGVLRLDMATGAVDLCKPNGADLTCVPGRDERADLDREIARLRRDNAVLKNALLEHGVPLPEGMAPAPPSGTGNWWSGDETIPRPPQTVPPTAAPETAPGGTSGGTAPPAPQGAPPESTFDRLVEAVDRGWRRFIEMMTDLRRELEK